MDFRGDMERNRNKEIGKRKCKQKENKATENQCTNTVFRN
jgi:hypothetical protein